MDVCESLSTSLVLRAITAIQKGASIGSIALNLALLPLVGGYRAFHPNIRLLLGAYCVACVYFGAFGLDYAQSIDGVLDGARLVARNDSFVDCGVDMERGTLVWQLRILGIMVMSVGYITLAAERAVATRLLATYEQRPRLWLGLGLVLCQWLVPLVMLQSRFLPFLEGRVESDTRPLGIGTGTVLLSSIVPGAFMEAAANLLFLSIHLVNKKKQLTSIINQATHTLPVRYQIKENMRATRMLIPCAVFHASLFGLAYVGMLFATFLPEPFEDLTHPHFRPAYTAYLVTQTVPTIYAFGFPIVAVWFNPGLKTFAKTQMGRLAYAIRRPTSARDVGNPTPEVSGTERAGRLQAVTDQHFDFLKSFWN